MTPYLPVNCADRMQISELPASIPRLSRGTTDITGLIAASFGTVAYNGFYCQPKSVMLYCGTNAMCGALGSYLPFQKWFNERRNKVSVITLAHELR
jgi:hypothetical protein